MASVSNLGLTNVNITGEEGVGSLSAEILSSSITNCYSTGKVKAIKTIAGGLIGRTINAWIDKEEQGPSIISFCYSNVDIDASGNHIGGLVGYLEDPAIIRNCYSRGNVKGNQSVGGLIGKIGGGNVNDSSEITHCYSTSRVTSTEYNSSPDIGGLIGVLNDQTIVTDSFWDTETSSKSYSSGGTGKTTSEMKRMGTFTSAGWDFESETTNGLDNVWDMDMSGVVNDGYPYLWWQDGDGTSLDVSDAPVLPDGFVIHQNYPNPFNPTTTISYDLPKRSLVTLGIYDLLGKQIKILVNQSQDAGNKIAMWNGTDNLGRPVSAGVYLYQIQAGEFNQTRKMLLLK